MSKLLNTSTKNMKVISTISESVIKFLKPPPQTEMSPSTVIKNFKLAYFTILIYLPLELFYSRYLFNVSLSLLWPVAWISYLPYSFGIYLIFGMVLLSVVLVVIKPGFWLFRLFVFISIFLFIALKSSKGKIDHNNHLLIFITFLMIFIDANWSSLKKITQRTKDNILFIFWSCQITILIAYFLSGLWKVIGMIDQIISGQINILYPSAVALQIANKWLQLNSSNVIADFVIRHYIFFWPFYLGAVYLEFFAIWSIKKPALQIFFALGLIGMHIFIFLTMDILFLINILFLLIFFVINPYYLPKTTPKDFLKQLPVLGFFISLDYKKLTSFLKLN